MAEPLTPELETLCAAAVQYEASDLLLHEGRSPQFRLHGELTPLDSPPLDAAFFDSLWSVCGAGDERDFDTSLTSGGIRFRVNLLRQLGLRAAVLRRISSDIPDLDNLGAPADIIHDWCGRPSGLLLVCGPTGSGKSTTLAAAIEWMNSNMARHIVTIEDPIEYLFVGRRSIFTQREVGIDTPTFAEGLRRSLRQNPDVIFVGEIRGALTAATAIQASETGHLVLATLHASSCADAVERLQFQFPHEERESIRKTLAAQLLGVLCQKLLPGADGGLALVTEYFNNFGASRELIAADKLTEITDLISRSDAKSGQSLIAALVNLVKAGKITEEVAGAACTNPQELQRALRGISSSAATSRR